ncbi:MAG: AroM family protein [Hyphomicrobiales bacterium]|nr:AroM family protein [Hyphomicrobiales bacterium]
MAYRVTFIMAGQTPRPRMLSETLSHIGQECEAVQVGALDGLSDDYIRDLAPRPGENSIITRLSDGRHVVVSEHWLRERIREMCASRGRSVADLTVIGSTGIYDLHNIGPYVIHAQDSLMRTVETLYMAGQRIGQILPLSEQVHNRPETENWDVQGAHAASGDGRALRAAVRVLEKCDFLVLHSMGYSETDRAIVAAESGKPVILVRRIIAGLLAKAIQQSVSLSKEIGPDGPVGERLAQLTQREHQVFDLVVEGLSNKEIARVLGISHRTVEIHRGRMMAKMGVSTAVELMRTLVRGADRPLS